MFGSEFSPELKHESAGSLSSIVTHALLMNVPKGHSKQQPQKNVNRELINSF